MEKSITELWGVVAKVESMGGCYLITIRQDQTNDIWEILVDSNKMEVDRGDIEVGKHIYANGTKAECAKNGLFCQYIDRWGRYCSHCGKHHDEGYWIGEHEYACSDECAIALMGGKEQFDEAMNEYDDYANYNPICWVEWYN